MAIFVSYSRKDATAVRRLHEALVERQRETWVDWEGIPPSADWLREIEAAIDGAEAFVFVLSPDSLQSPVCARELEHALAQHKRLLPVVVRDADSSTIPAMLARLNWVFLRDSDSFDTGVALLLQAIDTDLDWVQAHTRLIVRSREWEARALDASLLLRGADLGAAELWLAQGPDQQPQPTATQTRYIIESRRHATRRRFQLLAGLAVAVVAVAVLGTLSVFERRQADRQEAIAVARRLAAAAERTRDLLPPEHAATPPLERSLQLAAEAVRRLDEIGERSLDADLALRRALAASAEPIARLTADRSFFDRDLLQFSAEDELLAVGREPAQSLRWNLRGGGPIASTEARYEQGWWSVHLEATGQWVAFSTGTGSSPGESTIELRNARNLETVSRWGGLPAISDVAVGPAGLLATALSLGKSGGETRLYPALQNQPVVTLPNMTSPTFSRDGRWFAGNTGKGFTLWSVEALLAGRGEAASRFDAPSPHWIQFLDDGRRVATRQTEPERMALRGLDGRIEHEWERKDVLSFSPNGRLWLEREHGYALTRIVDAETGAELARLHSTTPDAPFAWSADSARLALANGGGIDLWRLPVHGSAADGIDVGADAEAFAFSPDEAAVTTLHRRGKGSAARWFARRWTWGSTRPVSVDDIGRATESFAFSADGGRLALGSPGPLRVFDTSSYRLLYEAVGSTPAAAVALSYNGRHAASLGADGTLTALDVEAGRILARADKAASAVDNLLAIGDEGRALVAVNFDGNFRVGASQSLRRWKVDAMAHPASQPIGQKTSGLAAQVCALSADGEAAAINSSGAALRVRATRSGRDIAIVDEAGHSPLCTFSADGRLLATNGVDDTLRIWDLAAKEEIARMELPAKPLALAFSRSGRHVAALDERGVLRRWPLRPADQVAQACTRLRSNLSAADWSRFMPDDGYRATCSKLPMAAAERQ